MLRLLFILVFGAVGFMVNSIQAKRIKNAESAQKANRNRIVTILFRSLWPLLGIVGYIYIFRLYLDASDVDLFFDELLMLVILIISYFIMFPKHRRDTESSPISFETRETYLIQNEDFVLYLRAFHNDKYTDESLTDVMTPYIFKGPMPDDRYIFESFCEQFFIKEIEQFLPSCAIGMSREMDSPIGAARVYVDDATWKEDVYEMMSQATWIIMLLEDRESCLWEFEQSFIMRDKTFYIVDDKEVYMRIKEKNPTLALPDLPEYDFEYEHFFFRWVGDKYVFLPFENTIHDYRWFAQYVFGILDETETEKDAEEDECLELPMSKMQYFMNEEKSRVMEATESCEEKEEENSALNYLDECVEKAHQGVAEAQYKLALRYFKGDGVEQDMQEAVKWLTKASDQGLAAAQNELGCSYYNGEGAEKDLNTAFALFTEAAKKGNANAQANLGLCYYYGDGTCINYAVAVQWLKKAAEKGIDYAQYHLGQCYLDGIGVKKDMYEARKWLRQAADNGHEDARLLLKAEKLVHKKAALTSIIIGILLLVGGILITVFTYNRASESGGYYFITWGPVIAGALGIIRGLIDLIG